MIDAADEPAVGRDAVEGGGRAEVHHDAVVPDSSSTAREDVDDPVGAHAQRLVHVERERQRCARIDRHAGCSRWRAPRRRPRCCVTGGTTDARHTARTSFGEWPPLHEERRRVALLHSSGVRSGVVVRRQCATSSSPRKRPTVISVLPMSRTEKHGGKLYARSRAARQRAPEAPRAAGGRPPGATRRAHSRGHARHRRAEPAARAASRRASTAASSSARAAPARRVECRASTATPGRQQRVRPPPRQRRRARARRPRAVPDWSR